MWVKFFAQSAVLSHPISSGIPVFSDFFVQNIRAKKLLPAQAAKCRAHIQLCCFRAQTAMLKALQAA